MMRLELGFEQKELGTGEGKSYSYVESLKNNYV